MRKVDLVLRIVVCVLFAPLLAWCRMVLPITGVVINVVLALTMVLAAETLGRYATVPVLGRVIRRLQRIPAYYAEHPPRPVVYYLLYPLLFPYWLFVARARREFLLYRTFNVVTLAVIAVTGGVEYWRLWRPQLGFSEFLGAEIVTILFQIVAATVLVMPLVTTTVILRARGLGKTLLVVGVLGGALAVLVTWKGDVTPAPTISRLRLRYKHDKVAASRAMDAALHDVFFYLKDHPAAPDTRLDGRPVELARHQLETYFKADEARAFRLFVTGDGILLLYLPQTLKDPIVDAVDARGKFVEDFARLDGPAWVALRQPP